MRTRRKECVKKCLTEEHWTVVVHGPPVFAQDRLTIHRLITPTIRYESNKCSGEGLLPGLDEHPVRRGIDIVQRIC
jgi:hypothetical protein